MKKERKLKINNKTKKTIVTAIIIIVIIYILYAIYLLIKEPTDVFTVEKGTLLQEESTVGYIIRNETILQGENYKNGMFQIVGEGEKAAKDEVVFRYYSNNEEELIKKISDLDNEIQSALENENNLFSSDTKQIEKQIDDKLEKLNKLSDVNKISELKKEISNLINKKAQIAGELSPSRITYKEINSRKKQI